MSAATQSVYKQPWTDGCIRCLTVTVWRGVSQSKVKAEQLWSTWKTSTLFGNIHMCESDMLQVKATCPLHTATAVVLQHKP